MRLQIFCTRIVVAFVLGSVFFASAQAEDRRHDKSRLIVMTLNAEFLWDGVAPEEGQVDFAWKFSQTEAEEHMQGVAEIIIRSDPDIVNLAEVENLDALETLNEKFLAGRGYHAYLVKGTDTYTGQDMGLLTRIDPESNTIERWNEKGSSGGVQKSVSKNYFAKLTINDSLQVALVGLHFLARPLDESRRLNREAQADAIRACVIELQSGGYLPMVMGDFNDYDGSPESSDHRDSAPITNVLMMVRGADPLNVNDDLSNVAQFVPKSLRYTAFYDQNQSGTVNEPDELTSIDHMLVAPTLISLLETVEIPHDHDPREVTDHFAVVARFRLAEAELGVRGVRVASLLPNPSGDENENEEVTLINLSDSKVKIDGWILRDLAGNTWTLSGEIKPGKTKTFKRDGQKMALNNSGDTVDLIDDGGQVVDSVSYGRTAEGEVVEFVLD